MKQKTGNKPPYQPGKNAKSLRNMASASFGFAAASGGEQEQQEKEACNQIMACSFALLIIVGLLFLVFWSLIKNVKVGDTGFFIMIFTGCGICVCCRHMNQQGYSIPEMMGGRYGGSGG